MFEYTCPKCRTNSAVATLPRATVSPCRGCGQPLRVSPEAVAPRGWGSPMLFAGSALAGLTGAACLILIWAFFGRGPAEAANPDQQAKGSPDKPAVRPEEPGANENRRDGPKTDPNKNPGQGKLPLPVEERKSNELTDPQVSELLIKSCVWIVASDGTKVKGLDGKALPKIWTGSGVLVDRAERLILTNEHVANESCKLLLVLFPMYKDGKEIGENKAYLTEIAKFAKGEKSQAIPAKVLPGWVDKRRDLALIKLEEDIPAKSVPIRVSSQSVRRAQKIHTMGGNPRGNQGQWIYSQGAVRQVSLYEWSYEDKFKRSARVIASQVPINEGDSGGPVVDSRGVLVGLNAMGDVGNNNSGHIDVSEISELLTRYFRSVGKDWSPAETPVDVVAEKDLRALILDLESPDAELRKRAVRTLGGFGPAARLAIAGLLRVLRNPNESREVREEAERALAEIGAPANEDFTALVHALTDTDAPDTRARLYAVDALGKFVRKGREAARALVQALDDPHVEVRRSAAEALGRIGWAAREEVFAGLVKAVKDRERNVRLPALRNLIQLGKPQPADVPTLKGLLADRASPAEGRIYAVVALSLFDSPDFVPPFVDALQNDDNAEVLETAARKLGALKVRSPEVGKALVRAVSFHDLKVRIAAARALGTLGLHDTTLPGILLVMQSKDAACQAAVLDAMPRYGALDPNSPRLTLPRDAIRDIKPLLTNPAPNARAVAAYLLGTLGRDAVIVLPELRAALAAEKTDFVQCELLCALLGLGSEAKPALNELKAVMNDRDDKKLWLRLLAALAVAAVTDVAAEREAAHRILVRALALKDSQAPNPQDKAVHEQAKVALAQGGKPVALFIVDFYRTALGRGVGADIVHAREAALLVLAKIGRVAEVPDVYRLLRDIKRFGDDPKVIQAAREAFEVIYPKLDWRKL
jgi:HEAT repeat protein